MPLPVGNRKRTSNLEFSAGPEPAFLKKFKKQIGYKNTEQSLEDKFDNSNNSRLDAKRAENLKKMENELSKDALYKEDEMPQVVIPKNEDILPNEVDGYFALKLKEVDDDKTDLADAKISGNNAKNKIMFRSTKGLNGMTKNGARDKNLNKFSSGKAKQKPLALSQNKEDGDDRDAKEESQKPKKKLVLQKNLLSFNDDQEEGDSESE